LRNAAYGEERVVAEDSVDADKDCVATRSQFVDELLRRLVTDPEPLAGRAGDFSVGGLGPENDETHTILLGAGVWIEFEHGDPDYPIWSGCWFGSVAEVPPVLLAPPYSKMMIKTQGGQSILLDDTPGILMGQFVQETRDRLRIRVVKGTGFTQATEENLRHRVQQFLGPVIRLEFEYLSQDDLRRDCPGKIRVVVSHVNTQV